MDKKSYTPFIAPEKNLPEITLRALLLGIVLTLILCVSNAYLGLKVGNTVSASIPAAIISMAVLRWFKNANVLENNIVQTMASVGEAVVAGVAFITPAMLVLGVWHEFNYGKIFVLTLLGGFTGVISTTLIRRVIVTHKDLKFPEGTAIAEVLKASAQSATDIKPLLFGGLAGGVISFFQDGFQVIANTVQFWTYRGGAVFGLGLGFSPALFAAGYIIGLSAATALLIGVVAGWIFSVPICAHVFGLPSAGSAADAAMTLWTQHVRYIGVGVMLVGGIWTLITLVKPIVQGFSASISSVKLAELGETTLRTEQDLRFKTLMLIFLGVFIVGFITFFYLLHLYVPTLSHFSAMVVVFFSLILVLMFSFIFSSLAAYFAGLVGATNCPGSGFLLGSVLLFSLATLGGFSLFFPDILHNDGGKLAAFVILVNTMVSCSVAIANDSSQDLKSGHIVGATPWRQQVVLFVGVFVAAFIIAPVLQLLFNAYGIGGVFPHPGMPKSQMLAAPQAAIMAAVVKAVFNHHLPWGLFGVGGLIALAGIAINLYLNRYDMRLSILAVGLGIYLPVDASTPVIIGGFLSFFAALRLKAKVGKKRFYEDPAIRQRLHTLLLAACGMVAGASLMGVLLAIPFAIEKSSSALKIVSDGFYPIAVILAIFTFLGLCYSFYRVLNKSTD